MCITAGPITKLCAWGKEDSGGHGDAHLPSALASHAGRREYSVSVVLSEVPLSVRGARPLRKASGRYARRRARAARYVRRR